MQHFSYLNPIHHEFMYTCRVFIGRNLGGCRGETVVRWVRMGLGGDEDRVPRNEATDDPVAADNAAALKSMGIGGIMRLWGESCLETCFYHGGCGHIRCAGFIHYYLLLPSWKYLDLKKYAAVSVVKASQGGQQGQDYYSIISRQNDIYGVFCHSIVNLFRTN